MLVYLSKILFKNNRMQSKQKAQKMALQSVKLTNFLIGLCRVWGLTKVGLKPLHECLRKALTNNKVKVNLVNKQTQTCKQMHKQYIHVYRCASNWYWLKVRLILGWVNSFITKLNMLEKCTIFTLND